MNRPQLGIQLYTLRDRLAEDFPGTLRRVAAIGYAGVEFADDYGGLEPAELAGLLASLNLKTAGMHVDIVDLLDPDSAMYRYAAALQAPFLTTSLCRLFPERFNEAVRDSALAGRIAAEQGRIFAYHNHGSEFEPVDGMPGIDRFYRELDPATVRCEFDVFWIRHAGFEILDCLERYIGRIPVLHLKDLASDGRSYAVLGRGEIDFAAIADFARRDPAVEWLVYEQDECDGDPLECARESFLHLKSLGV